jgi:hypothetical protein
MFASSLVVGVALTVSRCAFCPCVITPGEDPAQPATLVPRAYETAGAVFAGRVSRADTVATRTFQLGTDSTAARPLIVVADTIRYHVVVAEVWKGGLGREAAVLVTAAYTDCGATLKVGASYLLYAYGRSDALAIDACARVRPLEDALVDRQVLGPGRPSLPLGSRPGGA